jgi:hypothetical protein
MEGLRRRGWVAAHAARLPDCPAAAPLALCLLHAACCTHHVLHSTRTRHSHNHNHNHNHTLQHLAVIYTTDASLPKEYVPELKLAAESVGLDWDKFVLTNNTCGPHPPPKSLVTEVGAAAPALPCLVAQVWLPAAPGSSARLATWSGPPQPAAEPQFHPRPARLTAACLSFCLPFCPQVEEEVAKDVSVLESTLESDLKSFGRGFTVLESRLAQELRAEEDTVAREFVTVSGSCCSSRSRSCCRSRCCACGCLEPGTRWLCC